MCLGRGLRGRPHRSDPDFSPGSPDRTPQPRGPIPVRSALNFGPRPPNPSHAAPSSVGSLRTARGVRLRPWTRPFRVRIPCPRPNARWAQAPAHPVGGPHLGLLVSTLPLTSGTSPALRAPRGGWNPGDLAVVAEAVEACLLSPWKPPQARSRWGLRGTSQPRGRPGPQLPPAERPRRSRKPS